MIKNEIFWEIALNLMQNQDNRTDRAGSLLSVCERDWRPPDVTALTLRGHT